MLKIADKYSCNKNLERRNTQINPLTSRLCDISEWNNTEFIQIAKEIMGNNTCPKHRKLWEFTATILALKEMGLLNKKSTCISVAAGTERILFYLANQINGVVATDIYGQGNFADKEADKNFINNQKQFAPYDYEENNLIAANCNALDLKFPDDSFDFAFSMSSIEHFGGVKNANKALKEMSRVVKPGGAIIVSTEFAINNFSTDQIFKHTDFSRLIKNTKLSGNFNFSLTEQSLEHLSDMLVDDLSVLPHLNLKAYASIFTSAILILRKNGKSNKKTNKKELWEIARGLRHEVTFREPKFLFNKIKKKFISLKLRIDIIFFKLFS